MRRRPVDIPGWDSEASVVDERYIERIPRRAVVRRGLEQECRVLPFIASLLPLAVPRPVEVAADGFGPWRVRHDMLPGAAAVPENLTFADGERVGTFLRALHRLPLALPPDEQFPVALARMEREVLPLLPAAEQPLGAALLARVASAPRTTFVHRDLGPAHLLVVDGAVTGVIDWTDSGPGDPAIDLAWAVHGAPARFRDGVVSAYAPGPGELARALDWHRLGPWHEVLWGFDEGGAAFVGSGLEGVRRRL